MGAARPAPAGRIVAVANLKGGTGKSTIAVNLACLAARDCGPGLAGRVLLVDADPQGTAAAWLEAKARPAELDVEALPLTGDPGAWADRLYAATKTYARIVVDLPPQPGPGMAAALGLVDALVIPVTPSAIDLRATAKTLRQVRSVQRQRAGRPVGLLVPNRVDQRTALGRAIQQALRDLGLEVAPPIAQRASQATAFQAGQWIGAHAPGSPAWREMAAVAAKLDACLAKAPVNDYAHGGNFCLAEDMLVWNDDLILTEAQSALDQSALDQSALDQPALDQAITPRPGLVSPLGGTGLVLDDLLAPASRADIAPLLDRASHRPAPAVAPLGEDEMAPAPAVALLGEDELAPAPATAPLGEDELALAPESAADSPTDRPLGWLWSLLASMRQLGRSHTG